MTFRHILVQSDATAGSAPRTRLAARLAERCDARLTGAFLRPTAEYAYLRNGPVVDLPVEIPKSAIEAFDAEMDRDVAVARQSFEAGVRGSSRGSDWLSINGDSADAMIECMRRSDLTIFPRERLPAFCGSGLAPADLALAAGGPMLIVPPEHDGEAPVGRRVLVGWNGAREAARALKDAWPLLVQAEQVAVLTVSGEEDQPEGMLRRHFEDHSVAIEMIRDRSHGARAGEVLLAEAGKMRADLVVMGLYGHTRLRELVLGGASRTMLERSPVPLFVSH